MADKELLLRRMESLRRCISRIEKKRPASAEILEIDYDIQDIISVNLERSVQQAVDIGLHIISYDFNERPETMSSVFTALTDKRVISRELADNLRKAVGFRNIAVHQYQALDWKLIYEIITRRLDEFKNFIQAVIVYLD